MTMKRAVMAAGLMAMVITGPARAETLVGRGEYLTTIMGCGDCHTPGHFLGKPDMVHKLSGSDVGFFVPGQGYFWGPNLTPDTDTGTGKWTSTQIVTALRTGKTPSGRILSPAMPWRDFAVLNESDAGAIAAYLKSLPPTKRRVPGPLGADAKPADPYMTVLIPQ